jgi:aryl-alcohol dehydrogenase-like predicted oxidoreductase
MSKEKINTRTLGKSGIEVKEMGLGLWAIGGDAWGPTDDEQSLNAIEAALDAGVNFFDTADIYGSGHSEELLGRAMKGRRDRFVVATKIGWKGFNAEKNQTAYDTVKKVIAGVESNLKRLQTDYIDIIQSHISFRDPTLECFLEGFQILQQHGKVRAYGVSTSTYGYLQEFNADDGCATLQIDFSLLNRTPENEIFPYSQEKNIGIIVRGPLAMGILTGKFNPDSKFSEFDWRKRWKENPDEHEIFLEDLEKVEKLKALTNGRSLTQVALQFVLSKKAVGVVIPGGKTVDQVKENVEAARLPPLTAQDLSYIETITPRGGGRKIWPA